MAHLPIGVSHSLRVALECESAAKPHEHWVCAKVAGSPVHSASTWKPLKIVDFQGLFHFLLRHSQSVKVAFFTWLSPFWPCQKPCRNPCPGEVAFLFQTKNHILGFHVKLPAWSVAVGSRRAEMLDGGNRGGGKLKLEPCQTSIFHGA